MLSFIESNVGRIADRIQTIGAGFDPEVLSLPGGSVIALLLWAYSGVAISLRRPAVHAPAARAALPVSSLPAVLPVAACAGCPGRE